MKCGGHVAIGLAAVVFALMVGAPVAAQDTCTSFSVWMDQAGGSALGPPPRAPDLAMNYLPADPQCGRSLGMSGQRSLHCAWAFAYRADAAEEVFEALSEDLTGCFGPRLVIKGKKVVNHPDSYDLRQFKPERGMIALSLKDKAGLQETYVFLRASIGRE